MISLGSHLALSNPSMFHSFVDSFFEGKKALVKERLMDSVKVIVDGLFEEMVGQVKEMMLPQPKSGQVKPSCFDETPIVTPIYKTLTNKSPVKAKTVLPSQPPPKSMYFATKSKPGPSTSAQQPPFSGFYKRMAEEDGGGSNSQPNKKKAITVELEIDHPMDDNDVDFADDIGGDIELQPISSAYNTTKTSSAQKSKDQQQQQQQSGKFPCTEANCGKHFKNASQFKRHLRTHNDAKPYRCTYPGCSSTFAQRGGAILHIRNMHLKKKKAANADKEGEEGDNNSSNEPPPDPTTYLSVNEELLNEEDEVIPRQRKKKGEKEEVEEEDESFYAPSVLDADYVPR